MQPAALSEVLSNKQPLKSSFVPCNSVQRAVAADEAREVEVAEAALEAEAIEAAAVIAAVAGVKRSSHRSHQRVQHNGADHS